MAICVYRPLRSIATYRPTATIDISCKRRIPHSVHFCWVHLSTIYIVQSVLSCDHRWLPRGSVTVLCDKPFFFVTHPNFCCDSWAYGTPCPPPPAPPLLLILLVPAICFDETRGKAISVAVVTNFFFNLVVTLEFATEIDLIGESWTFAIFAVIDACAIYFIRTKVCLSSVACTYIDR